MFFKKKGVPEVGEVVVCTIKRVMPHCAFVSIDEYERMEAMIHISEVSTKWVKNIREFVSENKVIVCKVLKTDRGEIDVSLKRVSSGEKKNKMDDIKNELRMEKLIEFVGKRLEEEPKKSLESIGSQIIAKYTTLSEFYDAVKNDGIDIIDHLTIPKNWQETLKEQINEQIKSQQVELKKIIDAKSFSPDGITELKKFFNKLLKTGINSEVEMCIKYISAPKYAIELKGKDYKILESVMKKLISEIEKLSEKQEIEAVVME